ncbi:MAG: AraC family transcriptional regulator [Chloroflexota bacterium]
MSSTPFDFDYRAREIGQPVRRAVASIWYARGTVPYRRERIAPTGSTVAVFVLGDPIVASQTWPRATSVRATEGFLIGPHDRSVINEPAGETVAVGIITTAVGCRPVFGLEPTRIAGQVLDLVESWPAARDIRASLLRLTDPEEMLDLVAGHLTANIDLTDPGLDRCERAVALLGDDPTLPIASIARTVGVSHGHLDREFARIVALSPRRLARLLRVQRLLEGIDAHGAVAWASLAADLGWSDQSHLIRDVRRHTGVSPSWYVAAQRAWISQGSPALAGFVPEPM